MRHTPQPKRAPLRTVALFTLVIGVILIAPPPAARARTRGDTRHTARCAKTKRSAKRAAAFRFPRRRTRWRPRARGGTRSVVGRAQALLGTERDRLRRRRAQLDARFPRGQTRAYAVQTLVEGAPQVLLPFGRSRVRAPEAPAPGIHFSDLDKTSNFYPFANVAVKLGWADVGKHHTIHPSDPVTMEQVHQALVLALHLRTEANGLDHLHTRGGHSFATGPDFGTTVIGMRIGLRYNHSDEAMDVGPTSPMPRSEVAWSLYRAATVSIRAR